MKQRTFIKAVLWCSVLVMLCAQLGCKAPMPRRGGVYGDWDVKVDFGESESPSILSFSRDDEGNLVGEWFGFRHVWLEEHRLRGFQTVRSAVGVTELKDVKFDENKLSFVQVVRFDETESSSNFTGVIEEGKLSGTLSGEKGEFKVEGMRSRRMSRAVGSWEMKYKIGEREITSTLVVKADKEDKLTAEWQSQSGEHEITDLQYERGRLTFKRKSKIQNREWESSFEGTIQRETNTLSGVIKSEQGEITADGKRIGAALIGTWNLVTEFDQGSRKQRLRVNPDMSGLYDAIPIKKINVEDDKVSFKIVIEFGEQKFEMGFKGKLKETTLTGELTTGGGTAKVTGTKLSAR